jgi:hypothetical protein
MPRRIYWGKLLLELMVVFLGVTAGFILNNWSENQKLKADEKNYLSGFIDDIELNIKELENQIQADSILLERLFPKIKIIAEGNLSFDSANVVVQNIMLVSRPEIRNTTFETVKNSGNLNVISDYEIRKLVIGYDVLLHEIKFIDEFYFNYFNSFTMPFLLSKFNLIEGRLQHPYIVKTVRFGNVIAGQVSIIRQRNTSYQKILEQSRLVYKELADYQKKITE